MKHGRTRMIKPGTSYEEVSFKSLDLTDQSLVGCSFSEVIFENCNFTRSQWQGVKFSQCQFKGCNLSLVKADGCRLNHVQFQECKIVGLDFYKCDPKFFSIDLKKCKVQSSNFSDLDMKKASFAGSQLKECHFMNTNLSEAAFTHADLEGTHFHTCNLGKADFREASNYMIDPRNNTLKKAKFSLPEAANLLRCLDIELF